MVSVFGREVEPKLSEKILNIQIQSSGEKGLEWAVHLFDVFLAKVLPRFHHRVYSVHELELRSTAWAKPSIGPAVRAQRFLATAPRFASVFETYATLKG